jgi:AcrR family transcriptional regulator
MPRPSRSRNRILDSAHQLFWLHGYHAASLDDILQDARASTGSFYYHFHSKAHILLSLLDQYIRGFQPLVIAPACRQSSDPVERVMFVLTHYRGNLIKTNFRCGCLLGKVAMEIPESPLLEKVSASFDTWAAVLESSLHDARPPLPPSVDVKSLSRFILAVMEGAVMLSRAAKSIEPYDAAMLHLRSYLQHLAAQAPQLISTSRPPTHPATRL